MFFWVDANIFKTLHLADPTLKILVTNTGLDKYNPKMLVPYTYIKVRPNLVTIGIGLNMYWTETRKADHDGTV